MRFQLLTAAIAAFAFANEVADNAEPALIDTDENGVGDYCNQYLNYYDYGIGYHKYTNLCNG